MKWFWPVVILIVFINAHLWGVLFAIIYWIFWLANKPSNASVVVRDNSAISTGDLADLVLLRLELQNQLDAGLITSEQCVDLNQRIDALSSRYLAIVPDSLLWQQRRDIAWDFLNKNADAPIGIPPWRIKVSDALLAEVKPSVADEPSRVGIAHLEKRDENETQPAIFTIDEADHVSEPPSWTINKIHPIRSEKTANEESNLKQYAWKPDQPSYLERTLSTLSGWHTLAVPFLAQNIGWFIGVFCFIAGSMFLVSYTSGYTKNLIACFAFFIFTLSYC